MKQSEFNKLQKQSQNQQLSPFAQFCFDTIGYRFELKGTELDKWEIWLLGYGNAKALINNQTKIKAIKK